MNDQLFCMWNKMVLNIDVEMSVPSDDLNAFKPETEERLSFIEQAKKIEDIKTFVIEMKQRARIAGESAIGD